MSRLNKTILVALAGLYCILSTLPVQQCSSTNEFFIFDCPRSNLNTGLSEVGKHKECCETTPCCGKFLNSTECKLDFDPSITVDSQPKDIYPFDYQSLTPLLFKSHRRFYIRKRPPNSGFISSSRYILFQSFLC